MDDGAPVGELGYTEWLIVGDVGNHNQLDGFRAAGGEIAGHLYGEEAVFLTVHDEDGNTAVAEGLVCLPDGRHKRREDLRNPTCVRAGAKGCEC